MDIRINFDDPKPSPSIPTPPTPTIVVPPPKPNPSPSPNPTPASPSKNNQNNNQTPSNSKTPKSFEEVNDIQTSSVSVSPYPANWVEWSYGYIFLGSWLFTIFWVLGSVLTNLGYFFIFTFLIWDLGVIGFITFFTDENTPAGQTYNWVNFFLFPVRRIIV